MRRGRAARGGGARRRWRGSDGVRAVRERVEGEEEQRVGVSRREVGVSYYRE